MREREREKVSIKNILYYNIRLFQHKIDIILYYIYIHTYVCACVYVCVHNDLRGLLQVPMDKRSVGGIERS